jgi:hypothetical protein
MGAAKVVSLNVVASQTATLSFEVGGIIGESDTRLGVTAAAFDFPAFYGVLRSRPTVNGDSGRLLYDPDQIQAFVKPFALAALRAEPNKAALSKAINTRANAFYSKYGNSVGIAIVTEILYSASPSFPDSKPSRINILQGLSEQQMRLLRDAYNNDGRTEVVRSTQSVLDSQLNSTGTSNTRERSDDQSVTAPDNIHNRFLAPPADASWPEVDTVGDNIVDTIQLQASATSSSSSGSATEHQTIVNTDYGYRVPAIENLAQYQRAQISLIDEQYASFLFAQSVPHVVKLLENELASMDSDVYRTQIAYLNTILMSPIKGTVTGIYKNPGDAVRPGEPVIRVENNETVFLVATVVYRGSITIGSRVTVSTTLFDVPGRPTVVKGNVVAVRGRQDDEQWEVIVECSNLDDTGKPIFPLGYHFDYDDTTMSIS